MNNILKYKKYFTIEYKNEFLLTVIFELLYSYTNSLIGLLYLLTVSLFYILFKFKFKDLPILIMVSYIIIGKLLFHLINMLIHKF